MKNAPVYGRGAPEGQSRKFEGASRDNPSPRPPQHVRDSRKPTCQAPLDLLGRGYRWPDVLKLDQEARYPDGKALMWFKSQGVVIDSMATPYPVIVAKVAFSNANTFSFDVDGVDAYIFQAEDRGEVIDLVAWRPPATLATLRGVAFCVGDADDILNPATYSDDGALRVHPTALEWLKAEREGIVIVQPRYAFAYLSQARCIECADTEHAAQLDRWLRPPKRTAKIVCRKEAA